MDRDDRAVVDDVVKSLDLKEIVKKCVKSVGIVSDPIVESYVAQPKTYSQVSEFLSQKSKDAHVELYKGYVESLNRVSAELDSASSSESDSRHSEWRSLKLDETYNANAVWLHELFFANCFCPVSQVYMDSFAFMRLDRDFGGFDRWQKSFMACALAAGEGWAVTGYSMFLKKYVTTFVSHNSSDVLLGLYPVIVVDMFSHVYGRDYLNDKKSWITVAMREIDWSVVEERVKKADKIGEILR